MSTLRINTLENASGGDGVAQAEIYGGAVRTWCDVDQTGTQAIRDDVNVSSITDAGVGKTTVTYTNAHTNGNYAVSGASSDDGTAAALMGLNGTSTAKLAGSYVGIVWNTSGAASDRTVFGFTAMGYLA